MLPSYNFREIGTQKRRLHEILNIIQSVGLISKCGVGTCKWLGEERMMETLTVLKVEYVIIIRLT